MGKTTLMCNLCKSLTGLEGCTTAQAVLLHFASIWVTLVLTFRTLH